MEYKIVGLGNENLGRLSWQSGTENVAVQDSTLQITKMIEYIVKQGGIPYRTGGEKDGAYYELLETVPVGDERFIMALNDYLVMRTDDVVRVTLVG